jgi:polyhydroxyalkanoate synthase
MTDSRVWKLPESAPQPAELAAAWSRVIENAVAAMQAAPRATSSVAFDPTAPARAFSDFTMQLWTNPAGVLRASQAAAAEWVDLWSRTARRAAGAGVEPLVAPERGDRRFGDPAWSEEPVFDYLKQAYLLAARQATDLVESAEGIDEATRTRALFFTQAYLNALSPANFAFTNPEAIRRAIDTGSISLLSGLANLLADAASEAKLPQRRASTGFELGKDIAATPGCVVFQNALMQLIQYAPASETVYRRPLLYVPPLVNKYYLLDLQPRSSLIRWLVEQGHTVFVISWVNPGADLADKGLADYLELGSIAALDAIEQATGEREVDGLRLLHGRHPRRDRGRPARSAGAGGALRLFDHDRVDVRLREHGPMVDLHRSRAAQGDGAPSRGEGRAGGARAASPVQHRPRQRSDLVVGGQPLLLDKEAPPSDILHWFADGAHIPRAFLLDWVNHILRDNALTRGGALEVGKDAIDLGKVTIPAMVISLKDDHVPPGRRPMTARDCSAVKPASCLADPATMPA